MFNGARAAPAQHGLTVSCQLLGLPVHRTAPVAAEAVGHAGAQLSDFVGE